MGTFRYLEWAKDLTIASAVLTIWASIFSFFIRKYFFDMIGMIGVKDGVGILAGKQAALPIFLIVKYPIVQSVNVLNALIVIGLETLPFLSGTMIGRSIHLRIMLLIWCGFTAALVYQTVVGAIFYLITIIAYSIGLSRGEEIDSDGKVQTAPV